MKQNFSAVLYSGGYRVVATEALFENSAYFMICCVGDKITMSYAQCYSDFSIGKLCTFYLKLL